MPKRKVGIDDVRRNQRDGRLTFFRHLADNSLYPDSVAEIITIQLNTPRDPADRCTQKVSVHWHGESPYSLKASIYAEGSQLKLLGTFPQIAAAFEVMQNGTITPDALALRLKKSGITPHISDAGFETCCTTCARCGGVYRKTECNTPWRDRGPVCNGCVEVWGDLPIFWQPGGIAKCVSCGCTDVQACMADGQACHWLEVDYARGEGVCSRCPDTLSSWKAAESEPALGASVPG